MGRTEGRGSRVGVDGGLVSLVARASSDRDRLQRREGAPMDCAIGASFEGIKKEVSRIGGTGEVVKERLCERSVSKNV